ncbi:putative glycosyltransferase [Gordonia effusa NBRC 100432]|uniref:Putative glycosyltransferase n=1 Tax=Gordonia effusa NBRC 100432 TaxID=1077974 RepID=H0R397_9ACTN|nr:mycofactocin biosynthesis glycosyltransferase MftF [Gordonia effusa]GAB19548.1 putative glycosyltransferase [Gordonia effusa NBRC 100432]
MTAVAGSTPDVDETDTTELPNGFQVQIDSACVRGDLRYLVGGSPTRLLRMSDRALGMTSADGRIEVCDVATRQLARTLLASGIANPRPMFGPSSDQVTVVIPVRDNQSGVDRLIAALPADTQAIVVDDASDVPITADRPGVRVLRLSANRGPAAARNAGAAAATTDFVAFLDSDVVPSTDWLTMLMGHFSDPLVAIVAPRIVGLRRNARSPVERYENGYSSLDMGPQEGAVIPGTRVPYVPSAAMIVRRNAFAGFDESMRVAEDVDLCWRTHQAGQLIRYDPVATVAHDHRTTLRAVLDRRRFYGTGAASLAQRHDDLAAPVVMRIPLALAVVALLSRTRIGLAIAVFCIAQMSWRLRRRLGELPSGELVTAEMMSKAIGFGLLQTAGAVCRHYWPVSVAGALVSSRFRLLVLQIAVAESLTLWIRSALVEDHAPTVGPLTYFVLHRLDDLAYGAGLWQGAARAGDFSALRPQLIP